MPKPLKKKRERKLFPIIIAACIVFAVFIMVVRLFLEQMQESLYPTDVLNAEIMNGIAKSQHTFGKLSDIADIMEEKGLRIYPIKGYESMDISLDVMTIVKSDQDGVLVMAKGSGNVNDDIMKYLSYYEEFVGRVSGKLDEKCHENGTDNGFVAEYATGCIKIKNLFYKGNIYVAAIEYSFDKDLHICFIFATDSVSKLKGGVESIKAFVAAAVDTAPEESADSIGEEDIYSLQETNSDETELGEITEPYEMDVSVEGGFEDFANEYIKSSGIGNGEVARKEKGNISVVECTATLSRSSERTVFSLSYHDGNPLQVILLAPDGKTYFEPIRYIEEDKTFLFYVENPKTGMWRAAVQLENSKEYAFLTYYEISEEEAALFSRTVEEDMEDILKEQNAGTIEKEPDAAIEIEIE